MQRVDSVPAPPPRPTDSHKGTFGTVVIVGGCPVMPGAPALCARAAFRAGTGLVKVATDADVLPTVLSITPSATGIPLHASETNTAAVIRAQLDDRAVLALGPGWGTPPEAETVLERLLSAGRPAVVDADGLNVLARSGLRLADRDPAAPLVLTPHPGEYRRLADALGLNAGPTDPDRRPDAAAQLARAYRAVVLLKGNRTVVVDADAQRCFVNDTGNPALATAGTGDVLTGLLAALIAQGTNAFDAACLAAHAHGRAADRWAQRHGPAGLLADNLADEMPDTLEELRHADQPF